MGIVSVNRSEAVTARHILVNRFGLINVNSVWT